MLSVPLFLTVKSTVRYCKVCIYKGWETLGTKHLIQLRCVMCLFERGIVSTWAENK